MAEKKKVVVVGGGIGGGYVAHHLEEAADVTLIDSKDYFELRWATLRAIVEPSVATKCIWPHAEYLKKAAVVVGDVVSATTSDVQTADGKAYPYDFLVIASGSKAAEQKTTKERHEYFESANKKLDSANTILIVGGGPVGVELAGEIVTDYPSKKVTIVHSGERLLDFMKPAAAAKALKWLTSKKVDVILNDRIEIDTSTPPSEGTTVFKTREGKEISADLCYPATGSRIQTEWVKQTHLTTSLNEKGEVKVDGSLLVTGTKNVFAVGDVVDIQAPKQGYYATDEAKIIASNIKKLISDGADSTTVKLKTFKPSLGMAVLTLGRSNGIFQTPLGSFQGMLPTMIKSKGLFIGKARGELGMRSCA